jgi:hypothetical protein
MVRLSADPEALLKKCARLSFHVVFRPHHNDGQHGHDESSDDDEASHKLIPFDFSVTPLHELSEDTAAKKLARPLAAALLSSLKKMRVKRRICVVLEDGEVQRHYVPEVDHYRAFLETHNTHVLRFQALLDSPGDLSKYFA